MAKSTPGSKFVPDPNGFKDFNRSEAMLKMLFFVATQGAITAKGMAPKRSGDYARGITADAGLNDANEAVGRLKSTDFKSHWIEFGTSRWPAHAVLSRAIEAVTGRPPSERNHIQLGRRQII